MFKIMEAFVELLEEEDWLTDETKAFAKEKVMVENLHLLVHL